MLLFNTQFKLATYLVNATCIKMNVRKKKKKKIKKKKKKKKKKTHHISNSKLHLFTNSPSEQEKVMTEREREGE